MYILTNAMSIYSADWARGKCTTQGKEDIENYAEYIHRTNMV
jgi:hypothetical protein